MHHKIFSEEIENFYPFYPSLIAVIAVKSGQAENLMPAAWHAPVSFEPPLCAVAVASEHYSRELILKAKEFTLNLLPLSGAKIIAQTGGCSGRKVNKFEKFKIKTEKARKIKSPVLADAYATYECRLLDHKIYGDHTLLVGKILGAHLLKNAFAKDELLNLKSLKPALYLGKDRYLKLNQFEKLHFDRQKYSS